MRKFGLMVFFCGLFSCGTKETNLDVSKTTDALVDSVNKDTLDHLTTDSLQTVEQPIVFQNIPDTKDVAELLRYFRDQYAVNYDIVTNEDSKVLVLDRFTSDKKYKLVLKKKTTVSFGEVKNIFPLANISVYLYKDSAQCANAINNWFNCFGNDCNQIQFDVDDMIKSTPGYYIINPTSIICLDYKLEHQENNWDEMIRHLNKLFHQKKGVKIRVKPQGKLSWE